MEDADLPTTPQTSEPIEEIKALERLLHSLVTAQIGDDWKSCLSGRELKQAERSLQKDLDRRGGPAGDLIDYTNLADLIKIIDSRWEAFNDALLDQTRFDVYMSRIQAFRNPDAHSRELRPHERHLVIGIVGELRQSITRFRSEQDESLNYYPVVESVTDSYGNTLKINAAKQQGNAETGLTLSVGEVVEFHCRAWDPQGRALTWELTIANVGHEGAFSVEATGDDVVIQWEVRDTQVGGQTAAQIIMKSDGEYHRRSGSHDFWGSFWYAVRSPSQ